MAAAHSPGPWREGRQGVIEDAAGRIVAVVVGDADDATQHAAANVAAILTVPDLLDALCGCVEHMEWSDFHGREARAAAVAAIAKATGEQQ